MNHYASRRCEHITSRSFTRECSLLWFQYSAWRQMDGGIIESCTSSITQTFNAAESHLTLQTVGIYTSHKWKTLFKFKSYLQQRVSWVLNEGSEVRTETPSSQMEKKMLAKFFFLQSKRFKFTVYTMYDAIMYRENQTARHLMVECLWSGGQATKCATQTGGQKKKKTESTHVFHAHDKNTGRVSGTKLTLKVLKDPSNA